MHSALSVPCRVGNSEVGMQVGADAGKVKPIQGSATLSTGAAHVLYLTLISLLRPQGQQCHNWLTAHLSVHANSDTSAVKTLVQTHICIC